MEVTIWNIAERFGWPLEYVEGLSMARLAQYIQIQDGLAHARKSLFNKKGR